MPENNRQIFKSIIAISVFAIFIAIFYFLIGVDKTELPSQLIDRPAPQFSVQDLLNENTIHTESEFKGKITLMNVWASWCPSCYVEHPYWKEYAKNKDIVLISLNYRDRKDKAIKFLKELGNPYQRVLFDYNGRLGIEFGVYGAPETFLIDPKGKVRYRHVGVVTPEDYQKIFLPLIQKIKRGF